MLPVSLKTTFFRCASTGSPAILTIVISKLLAIHVIPECQPNRGSIEIHAFGWNPEQNNRPVDSYNFSFGDQEFSFRCPLCNKWHQATEA